MTQYAQPRQGTLAIAITAGPDGALWYAENAIPKGWPSGALGRVTTSGSITEFQYPAGENNITALVSGSDGNLWGTDGVGTVYKITSAGAFTPYSIGDGVRNWGLVEDAGAVWTVEYGQNTLLSVDPDGTVDSYASPIELNNMGVGPDGNLWAMDNNGIVSFNVTTHSFSPPVSPPPVDSMGGQFMVGPDGDLWTPAGGIVLVYLWRSLIVTPSQLTIAAPGDQSNLSVSETNYTGNWSGSSHDKAVATVARGQILGTLVVTAVGAGSCVLTIGDADHNTVKVKVTVQ